MDIINTTGHKTSNKTLDSQPNNPWLNV